MDLKSSKVILPRGPDLRSFPAPDSTVYRCVGMQRMLSTSESND